ncbi:dienelactone hydrolase family protein [Oculatella sp. LEGE 06141]|uniref:dienelactone hydrolase family protein n=1 Tax=Oculatella sp. LEGE 06141 TaxID=1828648 RepID=UPI0018817884|nr:dienelactone hydrolase family protein [Oculatella sp. LEGE 06141]MBE9182517.1 dienelactone hydrolase family protein [Oculatella sp. LEGE 06141]
MRKVLSIAVFTFLLIVTWSVLRPSESQLAAEDYSSRLLKSHLHDSPIATGAIAQAPTVPVAAERVTYATVDGTPVVGYLARPADTSEPLPGLIVIHEWWGLNDNIEMMTRRLAGEGYTALAVDLFGQVAGTPDQARAQVQSASQNPQRLEENLRQAYQYLETNQQASKIGSIGWCFGGSWSLNAALLLPEQLDATVIYYGGELKTEPEQLQPLQMPILGIFGALDDNPSVETVRAFESALISLNKPVEIHVYEGADHAFANPSGTRYNAEAAEDAWEKTLTFLNDQLS